KPAARPIARAALPPIAATRLRQNQLASGRRLKIHCSRRQLSEASSGCQPTSKNTSKNFTRPTHAPLSPPIVSTNEPAHASLLQTMSDPPTHTWRETIFEAQWHHRSHPPNQ